MPNPHLLEGRFGPMSDMATIRSYGFRGRCVTGKPPTTSGHLFPVIRSRNLSDLVRRPPVLHASLATSVARNGLPHGPRFSDVAVPHPPRAKLRRSSETRVQRGSDVWPLSVRVEGPSRFVVADSRPECRGDTSLPRSEEHTSELQSLRHLVC